MSTQGYAATPGSGQAPPPPPPPSGGAGLPPVPPAGERKRQSKKLIIISSIVLVVLAAAIAGFFIVQNVLRGGAGSPEEAAQKVVSSINDKDLVALYGMIAPRERESVKRVQEQAQKTFTEQGVSQALAKTTSQSTTDSELSLDGVDIQVSGVTPDVTEISEDYALIRYNSGEISMTIQPQDTKGLLRAGIESNGNMETIRERQFISELGPDKTGITLVASKTDGRWYVSPMLSALDAASAWGQYENNYETGNFRGYLPGEFPAGNDKQEAAAAEGVRAMVEAVNQNDPQLLAPALARDEAAALYLYGGQWKDTVSSGSGPKISLGDASFTAGPVTGNRGQAIAKNVSLLIGDDTVAISEKCIEDAQGTKTCLNGSGFFDIDGPTGDNALALASIDGQFALTTVKEDGKWKVSLLDTSVDMATSWLKSLTPEQTLSFLNLERAAESGGEIEVGAKAPVEFNTAGFAVRTMNLEERLKVVLRSDETLNVSVFAEDGDGKLTNASERCNLARDYEGCELDAGRYVLVFDAKYGPTWATGFHSEGTKFKMATDVSIDRYVAPPLIDGNTEGRDIDISFGTDMVRIVIPEETDKKLFLEYSEDEMAPGPLTFTVGDTDWNFENGEQLTVDGRKAKRVEIPLPQKTGEFTLQVSPESGSVTEWLYVSPRLYFAEE